MGTVNAGEGSAVVILNRNEPIFYGVPPAVYEYLIELAEDAALNQIVDSHQGEECMKSGNTIIEPQSHA